ncbi:glycosyltransferase family 4 protein [Shewanella sp.]|uniref:glycosyltransferase family 4 protein n=1 Tax=Shewanella sp. TaxID=50422 RepID=UPI00405443EC
MNSLKNIKVARISTVPFFVQSQLYGQLIDIKNAGADVTVITSPATNSADKLSLPDDISLIEIEISRDVDLFNDLRSLYKLYMCFKENKFDVVHSTTPKAGLLCSFAGFLARVPLRLHTFTGQTWVDKTGLSRLLFKCLDKYIIKLNHHCYTDSLSQLSFLVSENVCNRKDISVLGDGSLAGVDVNRFNILNYTENYKSELRSSLGISLDSLIITFVGRMNKDKGVKELIVSFNKLIDSNVDSILLLIGPFDGQLLFDGIDLEAYVHNHPKIKLIGFTSKPEDYLAISDIFCLPSYREGFGTVIIESAAMTIPAVASNIYGITDAVQDGKTGILVEVKNPQSLFEALSKLSNDSSLRTIMGKNAHERVLENYTSNVVSSLVIKDYLRLLKMRE